VIGRAERKAFAADELPHERQQFRVLDIPIPKDGVVAAKRKKQKAKKNELNQKKQKCKKMQTQEPTQPR
jgi:hypothetical protein